MQPPKILLVDDREDNLMSMASILEPEGYTCIKANSGRMALKILLTEFDFGLILMDIKMPNLNGFETATLIYQRDKLKHIPIIFITANHFGEDNIFQGYKTGAVDYIYKPVNTDLLKAKVAVFMEMYRKNQRLISQENKLKTINQNLEQEIKERKISENKVMELNRELLENVAKLEAANNALDQFAFMASHDLQEPLRKIRTFADLIFVKYKPIVETDAGDYLLRIQKSAERMQQLIKDLLSFSTASHDSTSFVPTDLNILVQEVIKEIQESNDNSTITIDQENLPNLSVNPGLIKPLFSNLIGNSIKYRKKDIDTFIKIRCDRPLALAKSDSGNLRYCRILVEDNGIGFDQKYAEEIFEMFRRVHTGKEYEGTGIGLALCKKIVEKHNGFISVKSKVNEGSTFTISLPWN